MFQCLGILIHCEVFYVECGTIKPYKEAFLPLGLTDTAAFHQILANLAVQLNGHRPPGAKVAGYEKTEVLAHHTTAMAMVQKRLKDPKEATSDGTIATVIAMACYAVSVLRLLSFIHITNFL